MCGSILFCAVTLVVGFRGVTELGRDVFVVVEVQRRRGDKTTRPAGGKVPLLQQKGQREQLAVGEAVCVLLPWEVELEKRRT